MKSSSWFEIHIVNVKSTGRFCQILVAFLEKLNCTELDEKLSKFFFQKASQKKCYSVHYSFSTKKK